MIFNKSKNFTDIIMWTQMLTDKTVLLKDGSFMSIFKYRGADLASATKEELLVIMARINNVLKRLDSGWVVYFEAQRKKSTPHPKRDFPYIIASQIDAERQALFNSGNYYENDFYISVIYLPPSDRYKKISSVFLSRKQNYSSSSDIYKQHLDNFEKEILAMYDLLSTVFSHIKLLKNGEILTYLHSCISEYDSLNIEDPQINDIVPAFLDYILSDSPVLGGYEPKLGNKHIKVIGIKAFPTSTVACYMDALNHIDIEYRWCNRMIFMDKQESISELSSLRSKFFAGRFSVFSLVKQILTNGLDNGFENPEALVKYQEAQEMIQSVQGDFCAMTYLTSSIVLLDEDERKLAEKAKLVIKAIHSLGFTAYDETINALEAWIGSIPGQIAYNLRRPLYNTLGATHLLPLSAIWAGHDSNKHLNGHPLIYAQTNGSTPFRLNLHYKDVGHTMILGPTGAGKSVHLGMLGAQFTQYPNSQVFFFDKDASSRVLTAGIGGEFYNLGQENDKLSFQPLSRIDEDEELIWAHDWLLGILAAENFEDGKLSPGTKNTVYNALKSLATAPKSQRTITGLIVNLQSKDLREVFERYSVNGTYGKILDSENDNISKGNWLTFEMNKIMEMPDICPHVLSYLFHRLETDRLDGSPTLVILDECWLFLKNAQFAKQIENWLRTFRKKNASVVFATQSIADIKNSPIFYAILESCYTRIFLPNPKARENSLFEIYESFGLNETEIGIIAQATIQREYYFSSPEGSRLYNLALGKIALAWVGSSSKEDLILADEIFSQQEAFEFPYWWYKAKNLPHAADEYMRKFYE